MKVITINSCKGGVGKTTFTILTAEYLSKSKRCLLIDTDIINHSLSFHYNKGIDDAVIREKNIFKGFVDNDLSNQIINVSDNIDLIHSDIRLSDFRNTPTFTKFKKLLATVKDNYDYVIIDTSPTFDNLIVNVLYASDYLYIPTLLDTFSHQSVSFLIDKIKELELDSLDVNIFFNQYEQSRTDNPETVRNQIETLFKKDKDIKRFLTKSHLKKSNNYKHLFTKNKLPFIEVEQILK